MYALLRTDQGGGYVAKSGYRKAYTTNINHVRKFNTEKDAERQRCIGNEIIVSISDI